MKINYLIRYILLFTFFSNWVYAQDSWKIDSTRIVFHISNAGLDVEGTITGIEGDIKFSKNKLNKSLFSATAKSETIQTGIKLRDKHLKKVDYFYTEKYPTIKITSKQITKSKDGFESVCTITIKGVTRDIIIPFTFNQNNQQAEFKGSCSLNRLDFGLGEKSIVLSDTVDIDLWVNATLISN